MNESYASMLVRRYRIALALVALLVLFNQALVQPTLMRLTTDAPLINVAGRQRMLSQRLAKAALVFDRRRDEGEGVSLDELGEVLELWSASHEWLRRGGAGSRWTGHNSPEVQDGLNGLTPHFREMRDAAGRLIRGGGGVQRDPVTTREELDVILGNEAEYLRKMDRVIELYEREAQARVDRLRRLGWVVTGLTLLALAALGRLILWPAVRLIRDQVSELGRARGELEARVQERTRELEAARERHRELLEQLSHAGRATTIGEMASGLAHELKQPLGAIANYAEGCLIALGSPQPAPDEIRTALERLLAATMRAGQIIERVRRFVTRQGLTRERFAPNRVVEEVVEILGIEARQRGIAVTLDLASGLPYLSGDPIQIQQVLVNLVRNSFESLAVAQIKSATLVIWTSRAAGGGVEFGVSDNGEGITPEQQGRVFDTFFSTRAGGMGMGLAICRTIVVAHQGRIRVESEPGIRTTFRFSLPPAGDDDDAGPDGLHRGR